MTLKPAGTFIVALCLASGCQQQMAVQPSYKPLDPSTFFSDSRSARPLPPGTVARGHLHTDLHLFTGKRSVDRGRPAAIVGAAERGALSALAIAAAEEDNDVDSFPFPITRTVLQHGQDRYMIYCVVCHDPLGTGEGKIVERGYTRPPSYHIDRLRRAPVGHFFGVITNGYGAMPDYKEQIPPRDRWAIVAYIRALQLSQHFPIKDLPPDLREEWEHKGGAAPGGGAGPLGGGFAPPAGGTPTAAPVAGAPGSRVTVWVLANGRPSPVRVVIGLSDGQNVEITGGALKEGDRVIISQVRGGARSGQGAGAGPAGGPTGGGAPGQGR